MPGGQYIFEQFTFTIKHKFVFLTK